MHARTCLFHIHLKIVNLQRECIKIDIHWIKSQVHCMHANGATDESHDEFVKVATKLKTSLRWSRDLCQLETDFVIWYYMRHKKNIKGSRETFFFFSLCVNVRSKCVSLCAHVRTCESLCAKGGAGLEDAGGTRKWYCFLSAGVCACASAFFPKNKIIPLPSRPYGTDNELVLLCKSHMQVSLGVFI